MSTTLRKSAERRSAGTSYGGYVLECEPKSEERGRTLSASKRRASKSIILNTTNTGQNEGRHKTRSPSVKSKDDAQSRSKKSGESDISLIDEEPLKLAFDRMKEHYDSLAVITLFHELTKRGICPNEDDRLAPVRETLDKMYKGKKLTDIIINYETFKLVTEPVSTLLLKVINNNLAICNIEEWVKCLSIYYRAVKQITGKDLAVSITSADGQRLSWGPTKKTFPLNELLHLVNYLMATDSLGFSRLHESVGLESKPTSEWKPGNPLVGAGALAVAAQLVNYALETKTSIERHESVKKMVSDLTGGSEVLFDSKAFVGSERKSEYLKAILSWMIGTEKIVSSCKDVDKVVQFYLECSSLQVDSDALSVLGATLANGGICSTTGLKIFCSECVEKVLSMMTVSSVKPGVPMVASSSGAVLLVVPGVLGVAVHSVDPSAPSYLISALFRHFALNPYERTFLRMGRHKKICSCPESTLFHSARKGDILTLSSLMDAGVCVDKRDYMSRTILHVAAAHGHLSYITFLLEFCPKLVMMKDLIGRTPLDEARSFNHNETAQFLENWEAVLLDPTSEKSSSTIDKSIVS